MAETKGTRAYWKSSTSGTNTGAQQILKDSGYINIVLQGVQYKASGNWWQNIFGGSDKITVSTQVKWLNGGDTKVAAIIQDFRKISVPSINPLAIGRHIVLKVPAIADGVEIQVSIIAVQDDNLGKTLQILNSDDFKQPLQLAPVAVGQILTITNLVKKAFSDTDPAQVLQATYPGIISEGTVSNPVENNRLVQGYIILIVKQDDQDQLDFDVDKLSITGNGLLFNGKPIHNTYMIYNVSFDPWRGRDPASNWSKKFDAASNKADELVFAGPEQRAGIIATAFDFLKEGNALLDADENYIKAERTKLKKAVIEDVRGKIASNTGAPLTPQPLRGTLRFLKLEDKRPKLEFSEETVQEEVADYAHELATAGLNFGFSFRPSIIPLLADGAPIKLVPVTPKSARKATVAKK